MRWTMIGLALALLAPATASADVHDVELVTDLSLADRATTGTDDELAGNGYDQHGGLRVGAEARLMLDADRYFQHGPSLGVAHQAGVLLGLVDGHAFRRTAVTAGWAARAWLRCMSDDDVRYFLTATLAVVGAWADAGRGNGDRPNDRWDERVLASETHDHFGLGWRLAFGLDAHVGHFIVGPTLALEQTFGVDTGLARTFVIGVGVRVGARIGE